MKLSVIKVSISHRTWCTLPSFIPVDILESIVSIELWIQSHTGILIVKNLLFSYNYVTYL